MEIGVIIFFIIGLILIVKGGDWFVDSSVELAKIFKIPPIIIGATVVSIATTLPEATVSSIASYKGVSTMAVGNAVGSMICNIGLLGGIIIIFSGINVGKKSITAKALILAAYTLLLVLLSVQGQSVIFVEGIILLSLFVGYLVFNARKVKKGKAKNEFIDDDVNDDYPLSKVILFFILGLVGILVGSRLLIDNGVELALAIGVSEAIISLSLIAFGTSLPELVTVITSLKKGNTDIGIGNIIGANIFNVSLVVGASSVIGELEIIENNLRLDFPVVIILTTILLVPLVLRGKSTKLQGYALLGTYAIYMFMLWT